MITIIIINIFHFINLYLQLKLFNMPPVYNKIFKIIHDIFDFALKSIHLTETTTQKTFKC